MEEINIIDIFKAAFNTEVENKVEIEDNKLVVHLENNKKVFVKINKMFKL